MERCTEWAVVQARRKLRETIERVVWNLGDADIRQYRSFIRKRNVKMTTTNFHSFNLRYKNQVNSTELY